MTLLIKAIRNNNIKRVKELLKKGLDPNICEDSAGISPLHFAVQNNALEIIKLLINAGADISAKNEDQMTVLDIAVLFRHHKIIDYLIKNGQLKKRSKSNLFNCQ